MIMDIGLFELELENASKEIQNVSAKLRELVGLRVDAYVPMPCIEDFEIENKNLSVKHSCYIEKYYIELCKSLECKDLPVKIPCWMNKEMLSSWKYNGKTENFVEKIICGLTSFCAFVDFVERCYSFRRECDDADFVDIYKLIRLWRECVDVGDKLWKRHKEKFYKFLVLDGVHVAIEKSCVDGLNVYLDCRIVVDYILNKFKNCCEKYAKWEIDIAVDEERN